MSSNKTRYIVCRYDSHRKLVSETSCSRTEAEMALLEARALGFTVVTYLNDRKVKALSHE